MRRKSLQIAVLVLALCLILGACAGNPAENTTPESSSPSGESTLPEMRLPEIPEDFFLVLCENNQDVSFTRLSCTVAVEYTVVSARPLTTEDIAVTLDQPIELVPYLELREEPCTIPFEVWAAYQGVSWHELAAMLENKEEKAVAEILKPLYRTYSSIPAAELPCLYTGELILNFPNMWELETTVNMMHIRVGDRAYSYSLGDLTFSQKPTGITNPDKFRSNTMAKLGANILPSKNGYFQVYQVTMTAQEDLTFDGLYFLNEEQCQILSADVRQPTASGTDIEYCWDMRSPIPLKKGDTITFTANCIDPLFANTLTANASRYLIIPYTCGGIQSAAFISITYRMQAEPFSVYAEAADGLDILSYFTEYAPLNFDPYSV